MSAYRSPRVGERLKVTAAEQGNRYVAQNGELLGGMEGPYADDVVWDKPYTGWGTFDRNAAHKARQPQHLILDAHQLQRGDVIKQVTFVAEDEQGRPIVALDVERPPDA